MDRLKIKEKSLLFLKKYRYVLLVLAIGLILMALPDGSSTDSAPTPSTEPTGESMETRLEEILSQIDGVGKVRVMLTERTGQHYTYQSDEDTQTASDSSSTRRDTVIITDGDRAQQGLIQQVDPPEYQGAVVVCQGGDRAAVRLAVTQAVCHVTGLGTDKISVLKMK